MSESPSTSSAGPSTLRSRSARPPSLNIADSASPSGPSTPGTPRNYGREPNTATTAGSEGLKDKQLPGGLWLPAVKGTIGGIESPRRHIRSSPSISTLQGDPSTPSSFPPSSASTVQPRPDEQEPPASRAVFRGDPTVKSCIFGLKMEAKDEIARLFGVA